MHVICGLSTVLVAHKLSISNLYFHLYQIINQLHIEPTNLLQFCCAYLPIETARGVLASGQPNIFFLAKTRT